eukprot:1977413-Amphidinium_carterae.1
MEIHLSCWRSLKLPGLDSPTSPNSKESGKEGSGILRLYSSETVVCQWCLRCAAALLCISE